MNSNSDINNSKMIIIDNADEEAVALTTATAAANAATAKNWPQMKKLCTDFGDVAMKILVAVDECECTEELNANNNDNPKGNKWSKLLDVCFGGGSEGRGLLAGLLPPMTKSTKLKQKVVDMWAHLKLESTYPTTKVDNGLIKMAQRQGDEYDKTKADDKAAADKQKANADKLQEDMRTYEKGRGALPPSAKGTVGGGRLEHSTNLKTNQPSTYAYANMTTRPGGDKDIIDIDIDDEPKTKKAKKAKVSAATVNGNSLAQLEKLGDNLQKGYEMALGGRGGVGKKSKLDILKEQLQEFKDAISFCKDIPDLSVQYRNAMNGYIATLEKINKEQKKALEATGEDE